MTGQNLMNRFRKLIQLPVLCCVALVAQPFGGVGDCPQENISTCKCCCSAPVNSLTSACKTQNPCCCDVSTSSKTATKQGALALKSKNFITFALPSQTLKLKPLYSSSTCQFRSNWDSRGAPKSICASELVERGPPV